MDGWAFTMSTFGGYMLEFPDIRGTWPSQRVVDPLSMIPVDYFRKIPNRRSPLACFLSHVHSDHLAGLESLKSPLWVHKHQNVLDCAYHDSVYCSAATKEILLRLERYPHRLNFAKGILESRKQQYNHLKTILVTYPEPHTLDVTDNVTEDYSSGNPDSDRAGTWKDYPGHPIRCQPLYWCCDVLYVFLLIYW